MTQLLYLLSRALNGYILIVIELAVYFLLLLVFRRKQKPLHIATVFVFSFYLFFIIAATGIGCTAASSFSPEVIWMPFRDIIVAPKHFILNIVAFIPFGFILPLMYEKCCNLKVAAAAGFFFSLSIELVQMFGWGVTETDDLMANTLGVCLGYFSCRFISRYLHRDFNEKFQAVKISDTGELAFLSISAFLIMAFVQPAIDIQMSTIG